jgi:hypothetical protein
MEKDTKQKQKSKNSKITKNSNLEWAIDFSNTSDIGYPEEENFLYFEEED